MSSSMITGGARTPRIGVTTYTEDASWRGWHRRATLVPRDFLDPLAAAGAVPVLLPPDGDADDATAQMQGLEGLLLVGGPDVEPARYGAPVRPGTSGTQPERDAWELALLRAALGTDRAVLGVCRGMQLINVALGGTLHQHIDDPGHQPDGSRFGSVQVRLVTDALPGAVLGPATTVACYHHQAVDVLGDGLVATGWTADGMVESLQHPGRRFVVGVQWHAEVHPDRRLFTEFVRATRSVRC